MIINLEKKLKEYEKKFNEMSDSTIEEVRRASLKYAHKWNKVRNIIEYQSA